MRDKITAVIITKNEEDKIQACLASISWVDEIVIVDDLSDDNTVGICESSGARVILNESNGDFDAQRNIGIEAASSEWVLQMDADEIVPDELRDDIVKALESRPGMSAYKFRRRNHFLGHFMRYGGWYQGYCTKMFRKNKARYTGHSVHETLEIDGETGTIGSDIYHYPFTSVSQFIERQNFYTSVEAKVMFDENGILPCKKIMYNIKVKPLKLFWKFYIKKKGFKDGSHGLIFSLLFAWVHFIKWAKYGEIVRVQGQGAGAKY